MREENKFPIFRKGNILKKEDLDLLRDNPIEILKLSYMNKNDGIITGFEFETNLDENVVIIGEGILKYNNNIYWMNEKFKFDIPKEEDRYIIKIKIDNEINKKYYINNLELKVEKGIELEKNEIEIGRFINRIGAELRNDYKNFEDLRRDYNLLEIINTKYSARNKRGTLHPKMLKLFADDGMKKDNLDAIDINFISNCLSGFVERENIIFYIKYKLDLLEDDFENEEIYYKLLEILSTLGEEKKIRQKVRKRPKKRTVD